MFRINNLSVCLRFNLKVFYDYTQLKQLTSFFYGDNVTFVIVTLDLVYDSINLFKSNKDGDVDGGVDKVQMNAAINFIVISTVYWTSMKFLKINSYKNLN